MRNNALIIVQIVAALVFTELPLAYAETDCTQVTQIPPAECEALVDLYHSTVVESNRLSNQGWNETNEPCDWGDYDVSCAEGHVTQLNLSSDGLSGAIPDSISKLSSLEYLYLDNNRLTGLPESIGNLSSLMVLELQDNQLTGLPKSIGNLSNLERLELQNNQLTGLPESFGNLSNLQWLELNYNQLASLPESFGNLSSLRSLYLDKNPLGFPEFLGSLSNLQTLGLDDNQLVNSPEPLDKFLSSLPQLYLNLSNDQRTILPEYVSNLSNLWKLNLSSNRLTSLPESFGNLSSLHTLYLWENQLTSLPESFGNLSGLWELSLSGNQLTSLPESFGNLSGLWELSLSGNQLKSLPESFGNLSNLSYLNLYNNQLTSLPESIGNLSGLSTLSLNRNRLTSLPESFGNLSNLYSLDLDNNQLTNLPDSIGNLSSLDNLYLNRNQLTSLPESILNLSSLDELHLLGNQLTSLPESIGNLSGLSTLSLGDNQLTSLQESFGNLSGLSYLYLNSNQLTSLPESFGNLSNLQRLELQNNQLTSLPESIGNLSRLYHLDLDDNQLTSLPESFGNLSNLQRLELQNNQLTSLPESFGNLSRLDNLYLNSNQLTSLPESIGNLSGLSTLSMGDNQLTSLPESIGNLSGLSYLYMENNQLTSLPESIGNLSGLSYLYMENNHLCDLPLSIINLSPKDNYFYYFYNNHLMISEPELVDWLNQYDIDWASNQIPGACGALSPNFISHDFGQLESNQQGYQLFTLTNTGNEPIDINVVNLIGAQVAEFAQAADLDYQCTDKTLAAGEDCSEYIRFIPNSEGKKQAQLMVNSDDPDYPELNIGLSAIVGDPDVAQADRACLAETPTIQSVGSGDWNDSSIWEYSTPSTIPGQGKVILINEEHTIIGLPKIEIGALCNRGELRSKVGEPLEIIASRGISNYGSIIGEPGQTSYKGDCGTPGSDVILKTGTQTERTDKGEDWWWFGNGQPIYNGGTIQAGNGGDGVVCAGKGGDALVLGRNTTNDYDATILAGNGGKASAGTGGRGGLTQVWGKLGGPGNLVSRGQVRGGNGGDGGRQGGEGGNLWLVSWPNVFLGPERTNTDAGFHGTTEISAHHAGNGGQGTNNGQGGDVIIEPPLIALTQGVEIKGENVTIFGGDDMNLDFSGLTEPAITATGDIILSVGDNGVINFEGTTATVFEAAGNVTIRANHILTDVGVELTDIFQANEIIVEPGQVQREVLLTGPSIITGIPNSTTTLTFTLTNNGPTADVYDLTISDTANWDLGNTLPDSVNLDGLSSIEFGVHVTLPADLGESNLISVVATSQTAGDIVISVADVQIITDTYIADLTTSIPLPIVKRCSENSSVGLVCNAGGQNITNLEVHAKGNLSNAVIEGILTNNGWASNLTITPEGHLTGGIVTGYIKNAGLMENFEFRGMSIIGGTLGGTVTNLSLVNGYFQDVHLAADTHLISGRLHGEITGDENAPALIEAATVTEDAVLTNLIIGEGTELAESVTIGKGVRFANATLIPEGLDFTEALSSDDGTLDLNIDIVTDVPSLLEQINQLPDMLANDWQLEQEAETGEYYVMASDIRVVVIPLQVQQAQRGSDVHLIIHPDGVQVTLVTAQEREIHVEIQVDTSP